MSLSVSSCEPAAFRFLPLVLLPLALLALVLAKDTWLMAGEGGGVEATVHALDGGALDGGGGTTSCSCSSSSCTGDVAAASGGSKFESDL